MINTDKYEGHTKGDNEVGWRIIGDNFVMNGESPSFRYIAYVQMNNDGENTIVGFSDADAQLIADTPLLLQALIDERAEVKRLTAMLEETIHHLDLMVGAFGIESLVEMVGEEE
jgi:hypothetical protein